MDPEEGDILPQLLRSEITHYPFWVRKACRDIRTLYFTNATNCVLGSVQRLLRRDSRRCIHRIWWWILYKNKRTSFGVGAVIWDDKRRHNHPGQIFGLGRFYWWLIFSSWATCNQSSFTVQVAQLNLLTLHLQSWKIYIFRLPLLCMHLK